MEIFSSLFSHLQNAINNHEDDSGEDDAGTFL